jgi:aryl-alcohol dehydrogenase-like predicted oxidoreductase
MSPSDMTRRDFVKVGTAGAAATLVIGPGSVGAAPPMPERPLGRTGHAVRLFSLGGQATLEQPGRRDESVAIINRAIDLGVNYIDTAAAYGRSREPNSTTPPISQSYIGEVMKTRRREVFLASKTHDRTRDGSLKLLEESLKLLNTDHLDLWQLHNVRLDEQLDQIFGKGGAIEALTQARDQKMVRFLGITGHYDPAVLARGLKRFPFDTLLVALNPADTHRLSFISDLLPLANEQKLGIIGMKIPARGRLLRPDGVSSMRQAMHYVLSLPISTVIVGCDTVAQLEENVKLAREFAPMPTTEMRRLEALTASYEPEGAWFKKRDQVAGRPLGDDQNTE